MPKCDKHNKPYSGLTLLQRGAGRQYIFLPFSPTEWPWISFLDFIPRSDSSIETGSVHSVPQMLFSKGLLIYRYQSFVRDWVHMIGSSA